MEKARQRLSDSLLRNVSNCVAWRQACVFGITDARDLVGLR